ncbi:MAG TPA: TrbI/VirB10 family protein [Rhodanobacter sp.]
MSPNTPYEPGEGFEADRDQPRNSGPDRGDPLSNNPYSTQYRQAAAPDLDAGAPDLRSNDLRRMNRRALLLLGAIVLLLLFVGYWMIKSASSRNEQPKPSEEKVTVAEAPKTFTLPQSPPRQPNPIPLAQTPAPPLPIPPPEPQAPRGPTLVDRRIGEGAEAADQVPPPVATPSATQSGSLDGLSGASSAQPLNHADNLMQRGTYIRCVLETHIVSDVDGFTSCLVTEPVYSFNGRHLLLPKGSKVLGTYRRHPEGRRIAVIWDRIITPTGIDVNMSSPGIDNLGGAGLPGHYDAHWASRISAALLISMLSDAFKYEAAEHGPKSTTISNGVVTQTPFESNTAQTVQNLSNQAVQEAANRAPTITINQGTIIYVYVAKDVDFSGVVARF